jgi:hypothetical protein
MSSGLLHTLLSAKRSMDRVLTYESCVKTLGVSRMARIWHIGRSLDRERIAWRSTNDIRFRLSAKWKTRNALGIGSN